MYYYTILLYIRQNCIAIIIVVKGNPTTFYEINAKDDLSTSEFCVSDSKTKNSALCYKITYTYASI